MDPAETVRATLEQCCVELMSSYGILVAPVPFCSGNPRAERIAAAIDFQGEHIEGTVMLWAETGILLATSDAMRGPNPATSERLNEVSLELVNQLAGRLKNCLLRRGLNFRVTLPRFTRVADGESALMGSRFACSLGALTGSLDVAIGTEVELDEDASLSMFPSEGDVILF